MPTRLHTVDSGEELIGRPVSARQGGGTRYGFTGHQTFPFRYGWLKKAIDAVSDDPGVFRRNDALVTLGVGKNMVESIRHWALAVQLLSGDSRGQSYSVSEWGKLLFVDDFDSYLEDPGSLWLIHWLLATNPAKAGTWFLAFNEFQYPDFRKEALASFIWERAARHENRANRGTVERDVDCFLRTYTPSRASDHTILEDSFNCPLVELDVIRLQPDRSTYHFVIGAKPTLPVEVFAVALLNFFGHAGRTSQTMSLQSCLYHPYSPGQIFKLDEDTLVAYAEELQDLTSGDVSVDETAGLKQFYYRHPVDWRAMLQQYYGRSTDR